jgi:hypothetical protein
MGFEVTRRHVDDESLAVASSDFLELRSQHFDMPIRKKWRLRV